VSRIEYIKSDKKRYLIYTGNFQEIWPELVNTKYTFLEMDNPIVVIDGSFEGNTFSKGIQYLDEDSVCREYQAFFKIHTLLHKYHADKTVLVYGDANVEKNYDHWCKENKQKRVFGKCIYRPNTLLQRSLEHHNLNQTKPNLSFKNKHFICLNAVARYHKEKMVNLLYENDWQLKGYISWLRRGSNPNEPVPHHPWGQEILKLDFDGSNIDYPRDNQLLCPPQYSDACFDIVNETTVSDNAVFLTDKTWKPILQKTPFIIHGSKDSHKHLEEYFGIKPYTDLFDYKFDTLDYNERFASIKDDNLERLLNMDINELNEIVNSAKMQELLEYNKKQLLTHFIDKPKRLHLHGLSETETGEDFLKHPIIKSLILLGY